MTRVLELIYYFSVKSAMKSAITVEYGKICKTNSVNDVLLVRFVMILNDENKKNIELGEKKCVNTQIRALAI